MDLVGNVVFLIWLGIALLVMLVSAVVNLMVLQLSKAQWSRCLPVAAGMFLSAPVAWLYRNLYLGSVSMFWYVLASGFIFSYLGIKIAKRIYQKVE